MSKKINKLKVVIFAYGFMGNSVFDSFQKSNIFVVEGIILPGKNGLYYSDIEKKIKKKIKVLHSDDQNKIFKFLKKINPKIVIISTFNKILNKKILSLSKFINIHHGKLPKQKGRASINWAIIMGRNEIYLTIHEVTSKLDSGKIILQKKIKIKSYENYNSIKNKIKLFLKNNFQSILHKYLNKKIRLQNNDSSKETWNCSRNPEDGMINFFQKRNIVYNLIRGSDVKRFPAYFFLKEKKIYVLKANIKSKKKFEGIIPGRVVKLNKNGSIDCLCLDGVLTINKVLYKKKIYYPKNFIKSTRCTLLND